MVTWSLLPFAVNASLNLSIKPTSIERGRESELKLTVYVF